MLQLIALIFDNVWHRLAHGVRYVIVEHGKGEMYLRCRICHLRSPGIKVGPFKPRNRLEGKPRWHRRLRQVKVA